ncbi:MAG: hypothetical protein GX413_03880 [Acetobacter sp.]|jgi:chromosome segregation ATPase|nr:hypothetical protein [Acetobacter sp.]
MSQNSKTKDVFGRFIRPLWRRFWRLIEQRVTPLEQRLDIIEQYLETMEMQINHLRDDVANLNSHRTASESKLDNAIRTLPAYGHSVLELKKAIKEIQTARS